MTQSGGRPGGGWGEGRRHSEAGGKRHSVKDILGTVQVLVYGGAINVTDPNPDLLGSEPFCRIICLGPPLDRF